MKKFLFQRPGMRVTLLFAIVLSGLIGGFELQRGFALQNHIPQSDTVKSIRHVINQSPLDRSHWSITIRDSGGAYIFRHQSGKLIRPASNLKLITSGMLLEVLGPEFRYKTPLYGIGKQRDSTWYGDLLFIGKGDPSISGTYYNSDRWHVFRRFYRALKQRGISRIAGSVIGNDTYLSEKPYPEGWSWNDLTFYYAAQINALSFNANTVELNVYADGKIGERPRISWFPFNTDYVRFVNKQVITPPYTAYDESYRRVLGTNTIILKSKLPQNYFEEEPLAIAEPAQYFLDTFIKYLERKGIAVKGGAIVDHETDYGDTASYKRLMVHRSHPLDTLLYQINRESSNFYTEMMMRTAAAEHFDTQGSTRLGLQLIRNFAAKMGVDTTRLVITDGSGMSGATLTTTDDLSRFLYQMKEHPHFKDFYRSLSVAGKYGTFDYRFVKSPVRGNLRGKSGYISGVRTLSGYLKTSSGRQLIISMATNHFTVKVKRIDRAHKKILEYLYRKY